MRKTKLLKLAGVVLALTLLAAACGGAEEAAEPSGTGDSGGEVTKGGTYRLETDAFEWNASLDPSGEYLGTAWAIYSNLTLRGLVTYPHLPGAEGQEIVPDLAEDMPEVSEDGLTYTFTLKDGVMFGPPVDREITSQDVKTVKDDVSGIETPDDKTIIFHLTEETPDFLFRLAMPATAPIPEEVAKCWTKAGEYGRYSISSGPYMYEGSADLDISSCDSMKPIAGFDPNQFVKLERNPNYDPSTDSPEVRENNIDAWELELNTNTQDIFDKIQAGQVEEAIASPPKQVLREYATDPELKPSLHAGTGDRTWYLTMNLTQPPFDDIHVRKALNLVMDKDGLRTAWGGPIFGEIANHILPETMLPGLLTDYNPYPSDNSTGDVEAAKEEMMQSKYDTDGDGVCDGPECEGILHISRSTPPWTEMIPIIEDSAGKIGLDLTTRELEDSYTAIQTTSKNVPFASNAQWGKDYPDASTFMVLFDSRSILPTGNVNYSLVGVSPEQNTDEKLGVDGTLDVPSVDSRIDDCNATAGDERDQCWADLDKYLMEEVVPWVPYLDATNIDITGPAVTQYVFDQFAGEPAWSKVAVDESAQE